MQNLGLKSDLRPIDETETIHLKISDDLLSKGNCKINAYNIKNTATSDDGEPILYNFKKYPDKAIDLQFEFEVEDEKLVMEVWLDTNTKKWNSSSNVESVCLSPVQFGQFFETDFYQRLKDKLRKSWPLTDDFYNDLFKAVECATIDICPVAKISEDGEFRKGNIDKEKSRDKNVAGRQEYTNSGRKIVSFSDFGVNKAHAKFYCWPKPGKEFKWSQWADWEKINPLARMSFKHNSYNYGMSISPFISNFDNRGWRGYNLDLEPKLQWVTTDEMTQIIDLSIVQKFLKHSLKRIKHYISMDDEEIFEKVGNPEKCTIEDIKKTKSILRKTIACFYQADTFMYE